MLPSSKLPPFQHCECPEYVAGNGLIEADRVKQQRRKAKIENRYFPPASATSKEAVALRGQVRIDPTCTHNSIYSESPRHQTPVFIHLPWSKRPGVSFAKVDAKRLEKLASINRHRTKARPLHFTLTPQGVQRLASYYPILTIDRLELQFFETYQDIPISPNRRQLSLLASKVGHRGRRAGYLLPPPGDVYSGLPPEMMPAEDETESLAGQTDVSVLDPAPIFPTSDQSRLLALLMMINVEPRSGEIASARS